MKNNEKRSYLRIPIHYLTTIIIDKKEIKCAIDNLSDNGALLKILEDPAKIINKKVVKKNVSFIFISNDNTEIKYYGKIIRYYEQNSDTYIAVEFNDDFFF